MGMDRLLSQCMIVKNEEENIAHALTWGRELAFEQIVVDTGSSDRTVEIAESLGAKVYHFSWNDDFSAAKNFALDKASGEWIAFLDADESMTAEDAQRVFDLLMKRNKRTQSGVNFEAISCKLEHLDDFGKVFSTGTQVRFFQHKKGLGYINRVHESLAMSSGRDITVYDASGTICIQHTGYADEVYAKTGKAKRNLCLLEKEIQEKPDNLMIREYLAESYVAAGREEEAKEVLEQLLNKFEEGHPIFRLDHVFFLLIRILVERDLPSDTLYIERLYRMFKRTESLYPDIDYLMGIWRSRYRRWGEAKEFLEQALEKEQVYNGSSSVYMHSELETIHYVLGMAYQETGELANAVKHCVLSLRKNLFSDKVLLPLLTILKQDSATTYDSIWNFLVKLYDFKQLKHRLFLLKCAKILSFTRLADDLYDTFDEEELIWMENGSEVLFRTFRSSNEVDETFLSIKEVVEQHSYEQLVSMQRQKLDELKLAQNVVYQNLVELVPKVMDSKVLSPDHGIYNGLDDRISTIKNHWLELQWLYDNLSDYRSKKVVIAVLKNWMEFNLELLDSVKADSGKYFDLDLINSGKNQTLVDVGAYIGDTAMDFVRNYGDGFSRIYCYEPSKDTAKILRRNLRKYPRIMIREIAVSDGEGLLDLRMNENYYYNCVTDTLNAEAVNLPVEAVSLDVDIDEPITIVKINTGGWEKNVLAGCREHIKNDHPKLVISVAHNYDDLWQIPKLIHEIDPTYKFHLRYYGGNLFPTEIVLTAL